MNTCTQFIWRRFLLPLISAVTLLVSCQKGDVGPQGAQGQQGTQGTQGPQGIPGNANEKTYDFTLTSTNWTAGIGIWTFNAQLPALTQGIIDTGSVYVYWTENETQTLMPFTISGVDYMYYTSLLSGSGALQATVTIAGPYAFNNPSTIYPVTLKVVIDP